MVEDLGLIIQVVTRGEASQVFALTQVQARLFSSPLVQLRDQSVTKRQIKQTCETPLYHQQQLVNQTICEREDALHPESENDYYYDLSWTGTYIDLKRSKVFDQL